MIEIEKFEKEGFLNLFGIWKDKKEDEINIYLEILKERKSFGGEIYTALKKEGNLINDSDILIASIVKNHKAILVTNNEEHFSRIKGLQIENWLKGFT